MSNSSYRGIMSLKLLYWLTHVNVDNFEFDKIKYFFNTFSEYLNSMIIHLIEILYMDNLIYIYIYIYIYIDIYIYIYIYILAHVLKICFTR